MANFLLFLLMTVKGPGLVQDTETAIVRYITPKLQVLKHKGLLIKHYTYRHDICLDAHGNGTDYEDAGQRGAYTAQYLYS